MNAGKFFKLITVALSASALLFAGYAGGEYLTNKNHRYTTYIDGGTIDLAKDMQAICDVRHVCNKKEIIAKFNNIRSEALMIDSVEPVGGGK